VGISEYNIGEAGVGTLALWATWQFAGDVILCKGMSPIRPFSQVRSSRTFLVYLDSKDNHHIIFIKAIKFMRPGDSILMMTIVESRQPVGDSRDTRYQFGKKSGYWIQGPTPPENEPDSVGWNDKEVENLTKSLQEMIDNSFLDGEVQIKTKSPDYSNGKIICDSAFSANAEMIVMGTTNNRDSIIECVRESNCSIIVIK